MKTRVRTKTSSKKNQKINSISQNLWYWFKLIIVYPFTIFFIPLIWFLALSQLLWFIFSYNILSYIFICLLCYVTYKTLRFYIYTSKHWVRQIWYNKRKKYLNIKKKWDISKKEVNFLNHHNYSRLPYLQEQYKNHTVKERINLFFIMWGLTSVISLSISLEEWLDIWTTLSISLCAALIITWFIIHKDFIAAPKKIYSRKRRSKEFITIWTNKIFFH